MLAVYEKSTGLGFLDEFEINKTMNFSVKVAN